MGLLSSLGPHEALRELRRLSLTGGFAHLSVSRGAIARLSVLVEYRVLNVIDRCLKGNDLDAILSWVEVFVDAILRVNRELVSLSPVNERPRPMATVFNCPKESPPCARAAIAKLPI